MNLKISDAQVSSVAKTPLKVGGTVLSDYIID